MPRRNHAHRKRQASRNETLRGVWARSLDGSLFCSCGKLSADTEQEAWDIALGINRVRGDGDMPQRVYSCNDDGLPPFHWTRKP